MYASPAVSRRLLCVLVCGALSGAAIGQDVLHNATIHNATPLQIHIYEMTDENDTSAPGPEGYFWYNYWNVDHNVYLPDPLMAPGSTTTVSTDFPSAGGHLEIIGVDNSSTWESQQGSAAAGSSAIIPAGADSDLRIYVGSDNNIYFDPAGPKGGGGATLTNWTQFTNFNTLAPGATEMRDFAVSMGSNILSAPPSLPSMGYGLSGTADSNFLGLAGGFDGTMGGDAQGFAYSNSLAAWSAGFTPMADSSHWFDQTLDGLEMNINGYAYHLRNWEWIVDPVVPGGMLSEFNAVTIFMNVAWQVAIGFALWWAIRSDMQEEMKILFMIPQPASGGTEAFGFKLGSLGQVVAASALCAAIFVGISKIASWFGTWAVTGDTFHDWGSLKLMMETGTAPGMGVSVWVPRVASWVGRVFPFAFAFTSITTWIAYSSFKWPVIRATMIGIKYVQGFFLVPLAFGLGASLCCSSAQAQVNCGSVRLRFGSYPVNVLFTNGTTIHFEGSTPGESVSVPNCINKLIPAGGLGLSTVTLPALTDGSVVVVDDNWLIFWNVAPVVAPAYPGPSAADYQREIDWCTAGCGLGVGWGFVSLLGYAWRKGLWIKRGAWGGES